MKKETTEKKTLIAAWVVCIENPFNPFVVMQMSKRRKFYIERDDMLSLTKPAWFFSTRQKALDFAWQMNAAARYALD